MFDLPGITFNESQYNEHLLVNSCC